MITENDQGTSPDLGDGAIWKSRNRNPNYHGITHHAWQLEQDPLGIRQT